MHVLIVAPEDLSSEETCSLKAALENSGAKVDVFCTDTHFNFSELCLLLPRATHLLVVLDRGDHERTSAILHSADASSTAKVALLCLHTDQALTRYKQRLDDGSVNLVIVRTHVEHARVRRAWNRVSTLVVDHLDLSRSAKDIARMFAKWPSAAPGLAD